MPFLAFAPQKLLSYSSGQMLLISACMYNFGLVICGVAVHFRSDVGLLFSQLLLCGPSTVVYTLPAGVVSSWFIVVLIFHMVSTNTNYDMSNGSRVWFLGIERSVTLH